MERFPMPKLLPQHQVVKRKRLLLAGADRSQQNSISTLLNTMGWACTVVPRPEDAFSAIQRDSFDAVLLDFSRASAGAERIILGIREIRPSLADKIAVISSVAGSEIAELIERYDVASLSPDNVLPRLLITLEDLVATPTWRKQAPTGQHIAHLLFDSFLMPAPAGVRSSDTSGRHLTYKHNHTTIDVLVDTQPVSNRIWLVGQVLNASKTKRKNDNLTVVLRDPTGTLARTTTNQSGEFQLQFEFAEDVNLEIRIAEGSWISAPLGRMNWGKKAC